MTRRPHHPRRGGPPGASNGGGGGVADDPIARELASQLMSSSPFGLLAYASTMVERASPDNDDDQVIEPAERTEESTFVRLAGVQSNAVRSLMLAVATLVPDPGVAAELYEVIGTRRGPDFPPWIDQMGDAIDQRAFVQRHEQADGEYVVVAWRWPNGAEGTYVGYVDFHLGYAITDGFAIDDGPRPVIEVAARAGLGIETIEIDVADARARLEWAIEAGRQCSPPYETDTWPASRPMLEWVLRSLPAGGEPYEVIEWTDGQLDDMVEAFMSSGVGAQNWSEGDRGLVELVISFAAEYGSGMPWHWSPQRVEVFLLGFLPQRVFGLGADHIQTLPELLRDMVVFAQRQTGVSDETVNATISAINYFTPEYVAAMENADEMIDEPREVGIFESTADDFDMGLAAETVLESLAYSVGGPEALAALDDAPLRSAPFDWSEVPDDLIEQTETTLDLLDGWVEEYFDAEVGAIARMVLATVIAQDPTMLTRSSKPESLPAAILGFTIDHLAGRYGHRDAEEYFDWEVFSRAALSRQVGVSASSIGSRSKTIADLVDDADLDWTEWLHSAQRRDMIETRDLIHAWQASQDQ